ncbi:helix-turn-helix domain-containing protein [Evansella clarkii]|uniref:helix-turn-helix domain-containing protein n=1 Tax=Evansella clarkii TaxID=79879 RepID=UPI000B434BAE|nr:hypothetical protein [Evansella clarkii]
MDNQTENKPLPNDKRALLAGHNYEMYNLDLLRKVFPRIIAEINEAHGRSQRKVQSRDLIALYFYLLSYVSGNHTHDDGSYNHWFGAAFPSLDKITEELGIDRRRIKPLVDILVANGLILDTQEKWASMRRYKLYFVSYCPRISDDGFIIDENGEKVAPDPSIYTVVTSNDTTEGNV